MHKILIYLITFASIASMEALSNNWSVIRNLNELNSEQEELAPSYNAYEHKLYFNSDRLNTSYFYTADFESDSSFSKPKFLDGDVNKKRDNKAYISFLAQDEAYISAFKQTSSYPVMNIYKSLKRKQQWQKPYLLDSLQSDAFTAQVTVSPDRSFVIFVSNRFAKDGDTDLWIAFRQSNDTWGNAMPLEELNSAGNEITPFLASSDTLYFASNGQAGQGGYDLFISLRYDTKWSVPRPLNGLNTEFDESDFIILPNDYAVFASDRPGTLGGLDLFLAGRASEKVIKGKTNVEYQISALVSDIELFRKEEYTICAFSNVFPVGYFNGTVNNQFQKEYADKNYKRILKEIRLSGSALTIECNDAFDSKALINQIEQDLSSSINSKVVITNNDYVSLIVDEIRDFSPIELVQSKTTADPPVLELFLNARPESDVKKWDVVASLRNKKETIYSDTKYSKKVAYNINNQVELLWGVDSLNILLSGEDKNQLKGYSNYTFIINKKQLRNRTSIEYKGSLHEEYFFDLSDVTGNRNLAVIELMLENSLLNKKLQIIYPKGNELEAAKLKGLLVSDYKFKKQNIILLEGENKLGLRFIARVLAEKRM